MLLENAEPDSAATNAENDRPRSPSHRSTALDPPIPTSRPEMTAVNIPRSIGRSGSGSTDDELDHEARLRSRVRLMRSSSGILTMIAGPLAGLVAWRAAGMGAFEACSLAFLVSAWLGPKLMGGDDL